MGRHKNHKIWNHFDAITPSSARCRHCKMFLSCKHTSANLVRHIYVRHHLDASSNGADKTAFLKKHKLSGRNANVDVAKNIKYTEEQNLAQDNFYDPLEHAVKKESDHMDHSHQLEENSSNEIFDSVDNSILNPICEYSIESLEPTEPSRQNSVFGAYTSQHNMETKCEESPQLMEKLSAEARYFNEMADLARAKRIFVELQCKKLKMEMQELFKS